MKQQRTTLRDLDARKQTVSGGACVSASAAVVAWDMMGYPNDYMARRPAAPFGGQDLGE